MKFYFLSLFLLCLACTSLRTPLRDPLTIQGEGENFEYSETARNSAGSENGMQLAWPLEKYSFSRGFLLEGRKKHWGIDLSAPKGTPILAAHSGIVIYTGRDFRGFGKLVIVEHGAFATFYSHCQKIIAKEGQSVDAGEVIALVGQTGRASGPHLHFEVRLSKEPVDPLVYLPKRGLN